MCRFVLRGFNEKKFLGGGLMKISSLGGTCISGGNVENYKVIGVGLGEKIYFSGNLIGEEYSDL